jgi:microcystin-dependent protein
MDFDPFDPSWVSSFQWPVPPPGAEPDAEPLRYLCVSEAWLPYVLGALQQLLQSSAWDTDDPAVLALTLQRADELLARTMADCPMIPPGTIANFGGSTCPDGWLFCDGSAVSRATYAALFAAIGTNYGAGDLTTTFNLPDLAGRASIGVGSGFGLTPRTLADSGGEETHVLSNTEAPSHSHSDSGHVHSEIAASPILINGGLEAPASSAVPVASSTGIGFASLSNAGGGGAHNNMQPFLAVNVMIKW